MTLKKRGRKPTTGRFTTREELVEWVWKQYQTTSAKPSDIARQCRVTDAVVNRILNTGEGAPSPNQQGNQPQ